MACVMCRELHGTVDTCVTGCYYAALVEQGVVTHLQLAQIRSLFNPTFIHRRMTDTPPEDRDCMIESFMYHYWAHSQDMLRGVTGILEDLSAELAEKKAEVRKLEDELAQLKLANSEKLAAEMVSERLKFEAELAERQLALEIDEKQLEVLKVQNEIVEHEFKCSGRRRRRNQQL